MSAIEEAWLAGGLAGIDALPHDALEREAARAQLLLDTLYPAAARDARADDRLVAGTAVALRPQRALMAAEGPLQGSVGMAEEQIAAGVAAGQRDQSGDPRWDFVELDSLVGQLTPGQLWLIGSLPANGKTALMFSQMTALADFGIPTVYLPLEMDPKDLRRKWAAWQLGYDDELVLRNRWDDLPPGAHGFHDAEMLKQLDTPIHFPPDRRVSVAELAIWTRWGVEEQGAKLIVIDHFHRMEFGGATSNYRVAVTEAIRAIKDLARQYDVPIVATCQLNDDGDPLDRYQPPQLRRLKESRTLGEEADVVLMLSRKLRKPLNRDELESVKLGMVSARDFAMDGVMQVTCRKHRFADRRATDRSILLGVDGGRVTNYTHHLGERQS